MPDADADAGCAEVEAEMETDEPLGNELEPLALTEDLGELAEALEIMPVDAAEELVGT